MLFAFLGAAVIGHAQAVPNGDLLNTVQSGYLGAVAAWGTAIQAVATRLFWTLVLISMVWTFGMMALRKAEFQEVIAELLRFMVFTGFYLWLLTNGPAMAASILRSLMSVAQTAGGLPGTVTPSSVLSMGFKVMDLALKGASFWNHPVDSLVILLAGIIDLVIFALIAVNMILLTIAGWMVAYAGVFFLGFGGSRWTSDMAIQYFKTALNIGIQLMTMVLLISVGNTFLTRQLSALPANLGIMDMGVLLVSALVLLELLNKVPSLVGNMAGGSTTGGIGQHGAAAAVGAMATGMAVASMAGSVVMAGARGAAGASQAVMAAYKAAGDSGGGSGGGGSSLAGAAGGDGPGAGSLSAAMGGAGGDKANGETMAPDASGGVGDRGAEASGQAVGGNAMAAGDAPSTGDFASRAPKAVFASASTDADDTAAMANADNQAALQNADKVASPAELDGASGSTTTSELPKHSLMAAAASRLGRTSAILAQGVVDAGATGIKNSLSQTAGGKVATAIETRASANRLSADARAEVKAFADKRSRNDPVPPLES